MEKFAFLFPGQGTQFSQMGKSFYNNYPVARQTYEEAGDVLNINVAKLCFEGKIAEINQFTNMQFAITTTETAIFRSYMHDYGISPQFSIGHSIGEYAALVSCGALAFSDALKIMNLRGNLVERLMQKQDSRMTIVENLEASDVNNCIASLALDQSSYISCYNSSKQITISGNNAEMDILEQKIESIGGIVTPLFNSPPMHSPLMSDIADEFRQFLDSIRIYPFRFPIISNITGCPLSNPELIRDMLTNHLVKPVLWSKSIKLLYDYGITTTIEMSPKILVTKFIKEVQPSTKAYCYGLHQDQKELATLFSEDKNYEKEKPDFVGRCLAILASTPNYNNNSDEFKVVIEKYHLLQRRYDQLSHSTFGAVQSQYREILETTINCLKIKGLPKRDIQDCLKMLLDETNLMYAFQDFSLEIERF